MNDKIIRPQAEDRKIRYNDDFELCYMRHRYVRRTDYNPTQIDMEPYMSVVRSLSKRTHKTYKNLFQTVGFEIDDLINICRIHLTSFLGLYSLERLDRKYRDFIGYSIKANDRPPTQSEILSKNKANFTIFLKQRMEDVVRICVQKARNIKGIQTNEFLVLYGPVKPPENIEELIEKQLELGFKKLDIATFKTIKRRENIKGDGPFQFAGSWYISIRLDHKPLCAEDLAGAGYDPHGSIHNKDPEALLIERENEDLFTKYSRTFKRFTKEQKAKVFMDFIERHKDNTLLKEEVALAQKMYQNLRL